MQDEEKRALELKIARLESDLHETEKLYEKEHASYNSTLSLSMAATCLFVFAVYSSRFDIFSDGLSFFSVLMIVFSLAVCAVASFVPALILMIMQRDNRFSNPDSFAQRNPLFFGIAIYAVFAVILSVLFLLWNSDEKKPESVDPEQSYAQAYSEGYHAGKEAEQYDIEKAGYESGYSEGSNEGYNQGYNEGYEDGYEWGYEDGYEDCLFDGNPYSYYNGYEDGHADALNGIYNPPDVE